MGTLIRGFKGNLRNRQTLIPHEQSQIYSQITVKAGIIYADLQVL